MGIGVPDAGRADPCRSYWLHVVDPQRGGLPDSVPSDRSRLGERGGQVRSGDRVIDVLDARGSLHTHPRAGTGGCYSRSAFHAIRRA